MEPLPDRVPLVIGVTGHRDVRAQDIARLEREIGTIFDRLRKDYLGGNTETPLVLVSALAEGADRVAARVALAKGAQLIAPLPMPAHEYRRDFEQGLSPGAAEEFDALLKQAISAPEMPFTKGNSLEAVRADGGRRAEQYRAVGLFIVQQCDVLIALWDGNDAERAVGGTAEVVAFKREGVPLSVSGSAYFSLDGSEIGPVIHVVTPRSKAGSPAHEVTTRSWGTHLIALRQPRTPSARVIGFGRRLFGREPHSDLNHLSQSERRELEGWQTFEGLTMLTREFNTEAAALTKEAGGDDPAAASIDDLFTLPDGKTLDVKAKAHVLDASRPWCRLYGVADALARQCQRQFKFDWFMVVLLGYLAFICFAAAAHVEKHGVWLIVAYGIGLVLIGVVFLRARFYRDQERFLDYRSLAEALRVAIFWNLLGMERPAAGGIVSAGDDDGTDINFIGTVASYYPIKQSNELAWVKTCLRTFERLHGMSPPKSHDVDPEAHDIARRYWVYGQLRYFGRQGLKHSRRAAGLEGWALPLFVATMALVIGILYAPPESAVYGMRVRDLLVFFAGTLPGFAAALTGYAECLAMSAQARQYDRMRMLFRRAYELLPEKIGGSSTHLLRSLYCALGVEAMKESADWVSIYRQRPIRPMQH